MRSAISAAVLVFLYLPIVVVVVYSFNANRHGILWQGWTLRWYGELWKDRQASDALKNSLLLASCSTAIATVLGGMLAYGLSRYPWRGQQGIVWLLHIPIFLPDISMAASLLLFFAMVRQWLGWLELGLGTMILAHVTFQLPFVAMVVRSRLAGLDPAMEEAARDLGADSWQLFWKVTFPLMWPGVAAGSLLAFTLSLDDFVVSFFTSGPGSTTLPILIYASVKRGLTPEVNALSTVIVVLSATAVLATGWFRRRSEGQ